MRDTLEEMTDAIASFVDYLKGFVPDSRERNMSIQKLEEAVFWLSYLNGVDENE